MFGAIYFAQSYFAGFPAIITSPEPEPPAVVTPPRAGAPGGPFPSGRRRRGRFGPY